MAVMRSIHAIPYATLFIVVASIFIGIASVNLHWTAGVQASYLITIASLVASLAQLLVSAIMYAIKSFEEYWRSGYPVLFFTLLIGYVVFKTVNQPVYLIIGILMLVLGWLLALKVPRNKFRFFPLGILLLFLIFEEVLSQVDERHWITCGAVGMLLCAIKMHRRSQ